MFTISEVLNINRNDISKSVVVFGKGLNKSNEVYNEKQLHIMQEIFHI